MFEASSGRSRDDLWLAQACNLRRSRHSLLVPVCLETVRDSQVKQRVPDDELLPES